MGTNDREIGGGGGGEEEVLCESRRCKIWRDGEAVYDLTKHPHCPCPLLPS